MIHNLQLLKVLAIQYNIQLKKP